MGYTIKDHDYRVARLSVLGQLKVMHKLLPVLTDMVSDSESIRSLLPADDEIGSAKFGALKPVSEALPPRIVDVLSSLNEGDTSAIIHPCLSATLRRHMDGWTPVFDGGQLMSDDVDLLTIFQLVARAVADSLESFLFASPTSTAPGQPQG